MIIVTRVVGFDSKTGKEYPAHAIRFLPSDLNERKNIDVIFFQARMKVQNPTMEESFDSAVIFARDEDNPDLGEFEFRKYNLSKFPVLLSCRLSNNEPFVALDTGIRAEFLPTEIHNVDVAEEWKNLT